MSTTIYRKRNQLLFISSLLTLFLFISLATALAYPLDKRLYLSWVEDRMERTKTSGLSGTYFSIGDIPFFMRTVDRYLNGVHVDPGYLSRLAPSSRKEYLKSYFVNLDPDQGYTQGKGRDAGKHPSELSRYDGTIILVDLDSLDNATAFHEAIHAFAFARRLGDLDLDDYGGPEFISKGLVEMMGRLRLLDQRVDDIAEKARSGLDIDREGKRLVKVLQNLERDYRSDATPEILQILRHMGGYVDFAGYRLAVGRILDEAVLAGKSREPFTEFFPPYSDTDNSLYPGNSNKCPSPTSMRSPTRASLIYHCRIPYGCGERCSTSVHDFRPEDGYTKVRDTGKPCSICPKGSTRESYQGSEVCVQCPSGKRFRDGCCL